MPSYNPAAVEPRWQRYWLEHKTFRTPDASDKPKYYILDMFPYPSAAGLHVGHPEGYTATDILARYRRMNGYNVLHPMGWDAFGLPAEKYAVKTGTHPRITTRQNIDTFRRQIKMLGQYVRVRADVLDLQAFSIHADQEELLDWLATATTPPEAVYLVHGEPAPAATLRDLVAERFDVAAVAPAAGERVRLD